MRKSLYNKRAVPLRWLSSKQTITFVAEKEAHLLCVTAPFYKKPTQILFIPQPSVYRRLRSDFWDIRCMEDTGKRLSPGRPDRYPGSYFPSRVP